MNGPRIGHSIARSVAQPGETEAAGLLDGSRVRPRRASEEANVTLDIQQAACLVNQRGPAGNTVTAAARQDNRSGVLNGSRAPRQNAWAHRGDAERLSPGDLQHGS